MANAKTHPTDAQKILMVGMDGGEWRFLIPLMKMGKTPVLLRLKTGGTIALLESQTMASPVEWTSVVTGRTGLHHGITSWAKRASMKARKQFEVISRRDRTVKTLWNILSNAGRRVAVFGWWATWPVEKVNGIMITDAFLFRKTLGHTLYPPQKMEESDQIAKSVENEFTRWVRKFQLPMHLVSRQKTVSSNNVLSNDVRVLSGQLNLFLRQMQFDMAKARLAFHFYDDQAYDLFALYLRASDLASHFFYKDCCPGEVEAQWKRTVSESPRFAQIIPAVYQLYDRYMGLLLGKTRTQGSVIVLSDHGFGSGPYYQQFHWKRFLKSTRLMLQKKKANSLFRCKTLKNGLIEIGLNSTHNRGVPPSRQGEGKALLQELLRYMRQIQTTDGRPLFTALNVMGEPLRLQLQVNSSILLHDTLHYPGGVVKAFKFFRYSKFSGAHRRMGVLMLNGPPFRAHTIYPEKITTMDIFPLSLYLQRQAIPLDIDARFHEDIVNSEWKKRHPPLPPVKTYEGPSKGETPSEEPTIDPETNKKLIEELRTIGYIS